MDELHKLTITELAELLAGGRTSSKEICAAFLGRAAALEKNIGAFTKLDEADVIAQAEASDRRRASASALGPCDGIPVAIKDNITVAGQPCTCASKILDSFVSPYDSTAAERLRAKGFVLFGRTNMDEFAMGSSCENSAISRTVNPWNAERVPGGSSGGSAAAVAAREVPAALGSDTGGSIRQPASFCGCVGLKPSYGRVSRYGLVAFASSLDQIGPIANSVKDAAIIYDAISGHDGRDSTSIREPCGSTLAALDGAEDLRGVRIGLPKEYFEAGGLDDGIKETVFKAVEAMKDLGAETLEISLPHTRYAIAAYYVIATAEASANLARFDGIRYGNRAKADNLMQTYLSSRGHGFGREVKRRIVLGTFVLSSGYYDAYYLRAQKVRTLIRRDFEEAFERCDAILSPVSPVPAFKFGEKSDPLQMYLADIYTIAANLAGICAISVPADLHKATGLPVGVQLAGPFLGEKHILRISHVFEKNRAVKSFMPPI